MRRGEDVRGRRQHNRRWRSVAGRAAAVVVAVAAVAAVAAGGAAAAPATAVFAGVHDGAGATDGVATATRNAADDGDGNGTIQTTGTTVPFRIIADEGADPYEYAYLVDGNASLITDGENAASPAGPDGVGERVIDHPNGTATIEGIVADGGGDSFAVESEPLCAFRPLEESPPASITRLYDGRSLPSEPRCGVITTPERVTVLSDEGADAFEYEIRVRGRVELITEGEVSATPAGPDGVGETVEENPDGTVTIRGIVADGGGDAFQLRGAPGTREILDVDLRGPGTVLRDGRQVFPDPNADTDPGSGGGDDPAPFRVLADEGAGVIEYAYLVDGDAELITDGKNAAGPAGPDGVGETVTDHPNGTVTITGDVTGGGGDSFSIEGRPICTLRTGPVTLRFDGANVGPLPRCADVTTPRRLVVLAADGADAFEYDVRVSGSAELITEGPNSSTPAGSDGRGETVTDNDDGTVTISGIVANGGGDAFQIEGSVRDVDLRGRGTVLVDGRPVSGGDGSSVDLSVSQVRRDGFPRVTVFASVVAPTGAPITGLTAQDLTVAEEGRDERIEAVRRVGGGTDVSVSLVIDRSASMDDDQKIDEARSAAQQFVGQLRSADEAQVVSFSSDVTVDQRWTRDRGALDAAIGSISTSGSTALYDATVRGVEGAAPRAGRSAVIVLADGQNNEGSASIQDVIDTARARNVPVYTIALSPIENEAALTRIATETGGESYTVASPSNLADIYDRISQRISEEYRIEYRTSDTATDGTRREVTVTASASGAVASGSGSYVAPCAPLPDASFDAGASGLDVSFDGSASVANGGSITAYRWDFNNDGQVDARGPRATHSYPAAGTYEAKLTVEKACGAADSAVRSVTVSGGSATIGVENATVSRGGTTTLELSADADGVAGYRAEISFDPSRLRIVDVTGADLADPVRDLDDGAGSLVLTQSRASGVDDPTLARIQVEAIAGGPPASLTLDEAGTSLNGETTTLPIARYDDGSVTIRSCSDGDANRDGQVTTLDATLVKRAVAGLPITGTYDADCADYSGDGTTTPLDATGILREVAGLSTAGAAVVPATTGAADSGPVLRVGSVTARANDTVTVPLAVANASRVAGYRAALTFDPDVVRVESTTGVAFADPVSNVDNETGRVVLTQSRARGLDDPVLANLTLTVVGAPGASSPLSFDASNTSINNETSRLPVTTTDGSVRVTNESGSGSPTAGNGTGDGSAAPSPVPGVSDDPPTDPDGDGRFEDVDGDGAVTYRDVVALFAAFEAVKSGTGPTAFDFNRNGRLDFADIVALYTKR
jgi:VWFA-related protein